MKYRKDVLLARLSLVALIILILGIVVSVVSRVSAHKSNQQQVAEVLEETEVSEVVTVDDSEFAEVVVSTDDEEANKTTYLVTTAEINFRQDPTTDGAVIAVLAEGTELELVDEAEGWSKVIYSDETGYVNSNYVKVLEKSDGEDDGEQDIVVMITTTSIKMRTGPGSEYDEISEIGPDVELNVFSIANGWAKIYYGGETGYVSATYLVEK